MGKGPGAGGRRGHSPGPGEGTLSVEKGGDATASAVRALRSSPTRGETRVREQRRHRIGRMWLFLSEPCSRRMWLFLSDGELGGVGDEGAVSLQGALLE